LGVNNLPPVVFFAGFASVIENFRELLVALTESFTVHYVETRDKESSVLPEGAGFTVYDVASDISGSIDALGMPEGKYIIVAFSLGSTATAEAFRSFPLRRPELVIMASPNGKFRIPPIGIFIASYLSWSFWLIRPFLKWYIKTFHVNTREDFEMYNISVRALDKSDPRKMAPTLLEMVKYEIWDALDKIDVPVIVIGASKDIFHTHDDALEISTAIVNSKYYDLGTNKRTHSREVCDLLLGHLKEINA
jgi:pimeloyl-ACP methyl ester carboxylesterase